MKEIYKEAVKDAHSTYKTVCLRMSLLSGLRILKYDHLDQKKKRNRY